MDCSPPGSFVHGILQAGILEWGAISFSRESSWPREQTCISCVSLISRWILYHLYQLIPMPNTNQSILEEISPGCSLEGLMLKLKLQYLGHLMRRVDSLEKILMLEGIGGGRRRGWQRMRWLDGITDSMDMNWVNSGSWWWTGRPGVLRFMGLQRARHDWATERNWTPSYGFGDFDNVLKMYLLQKTILDPSPYILIVLEVFY